MGISVGRAFQAKRKTNGVGGGDLVNLCTVARQAPLSTEFSKQEY